MASKFVRAAHGIFRPSTGHHSENTFELTGGAADDELEKWYWYPLFEGSNK